jgi:hypothetical protein
VGALSADGFSRLAEMNAGNAADLSVLAQRP